MSEPFLVPIQPPGGPHTALDVLNWGAPQIPYDQYPIGAAYAFIVLSWYTVGSLCTLESLYACYTESDPDDLRADVNDLIDLGLVRWQRQGGAV